MLTPQVKSQFVTKIIQNEAGRFQVVFLVALVDGKINAKIVNVKPLTIHDEKINIFLPCATNHCVKAESRKIFSSKTISPYFTLDFFTSQQTRAPSK